MFDSILIANRGEIAVRVIRTVRAMGLRSIAVYSDADADAKHVREADDAVRIGPAAARESYLSIERILDAARQTGAQAIHPGYGFLAENAAFARACADAGIVFIGPPASAIEAMGDKIRAKLTVSAAGVPVVPGRTEPGLSDAEVRAAAIEVGFPVLLKPSAGGGGKGMRLVHEESELDGAIESARREARGSFGDDTLLVERFVQRPRHIEIQVLADTHGNAVHLGERECSLQRRHQKIIEEAPSPLLDAATRERMGAAAVNAAKAVDYTGAGTVEFIVSADRPDEFFFMEMNTRLQVEHPVTELVTGIDLVEQQILVAAGEPLGFSSVTLTGHAVEARVYAEDPAHGFLPTGGTVLALREPSEVRVDSALVTGGVVGSDYDPMLAKVIAWAPSRTAALRKLSGALGRTAVLGLGTNVPFLRALLADPDVVAGTLDTQLVERKLDSLVAQEVPDAVFVAAALDQLLAVRPTGAVVDPWDVPDNWRLGGRGGTSSRLACADRQVTVRVTGGASAASVVVDDGPAVEASADWDGDDLVVRIGARVHRYLRHADGDVLWLAADGQVWPVAEHSILEGEAAAGALGGPLVSPMPGTVLLVKAQQGEQVSAGQPLLVIEAMKMEHTIAAPVDGVLTEMRVQAGQQVALNQPVALVTPSEEQS
ncbi:biotin carboxylase N-terminal domain-containing protein [Labedaea rhizosphaerae]|uniref:ATP-binding protein n=1 Tax=Labedaea rhizosphaerae TaxID=598644 RepID=UPI001061FA7D|nr:biotin carboxylase N-terminal domain-containing protein [Labedaea rhizosphaerae]